MNRIQEDGTQSGYRLLLSEDIFTSLYGNVLLLFMERIGLPWGGAGSLVHIKKSACLYCCATFWPMPKTWEEIVEIVLESKVC